MNTNINRWIFEIPLSDVKTTEDDTTLDECCFLCGRKLKGQQYVVHLLTNGNLVSTDQPFNDREDQGFFPIGSECRKRLPNNFYFKL
jgi:hypothetical protein